MAEYKLCAIPDCRKPAHKGKHCSMHAERIRKHGDPQKGAFKPKGNCLLLDCDATHYGHGYCRAHYKRWKKYGDPYGGSTKWGEVRDWVQDAAKSHGGDDCLIFPYARDKYGYGHVNYKGRYRGAHALVLELAVGKRPTRRHECCHTCGNGHLGCVNPNHMYWGTRSDNVQDAIRHGTFSNTAKSVVTQEH